MINRFMGAHRFLSNFYEVPVQVDGVTYRTAEHAFQAAKTLNPSFKAQIASAELPSRAKFYGQKAPLRADWEEAKFAEMAKVIHAKFTQNPELTKALLATGTEALVEGNHWHDQIWGDCNCSRHANTPGKNFLGKILMHMRTELQVATGESKNL